MTKIHLIISVLVLAFVACSQKADDTTLDATTNLHEYFVGIIKPGPNWTAESTPEVAKIQEAHMANIQKLSDEGLLVLAGPFYNQPEGVYLSGLFFFKTETIQEARALAKNDPAVKASRLTVEVFSWFGPKDLSFDKPWSPEVYVATILMKGPRFNDRSVPEFDTLRAYIERSLPAWDPEAKLSIGGAFKKSNVMLIPHSLIIIRADSASYIDSMWAGYPVVQQGLLDPLVVTWYGPKGLTGKYTQD